MSGPPGSEPAVRCHWCGASLGIAAVRLSGRTICPQCGAATTDPFPGPEALAAAYGDWYRPAGRRFAGFGDRLLARSRAALARRVDRLAPPGAVLDVGAGAGWLLDALRARGRTAVGLERSGQRDDMRDASVTELDGEWAAVVFWHSLEHLSDPGGAIAAAGRLLVPDGLVVVAIPDNASLQAHAFGDAWLHLDLPRHLVHLTRGALTARLEAEGLEVTRVSGWRGGQVVIGWLDGLVGRLPGRLDLYEALRDPGAQSVPMSAGRRAASMVAGAAMLPVGALCAAGEIAIGRSGTAYVEARARSRPSSSTA